MSATPRNQYADTNIPGLLTAGAQNISGDKTLEDALIVEGALTPSGGIVGRVDGAAIAAGMIGETREVTVTSSVTGDTTTATYVTAATLSNLTKGKWHIEGQFPNISTTGTAGDTGNAVQGRLTAIRILKNGTTEIAKTYLPGLAKSTVNSGYHLTSGTIYAIETNTADTDDYELQFASVNNSGTPTITAFSASASATTPIKLTATRIA